jgi:anti-sigma-K factor RskA
VTPREHDTHAESIGAYALGALPDLEAQVFERHLMGCTECQDELQRLNEAAHALPRAVTPYEAPASLKASLMATVRAEARAEQAAPAPAKRRRSWLPRLRPAFALAGAVVLLALAVYGATRDTGDGDESRTVAVQVDDSLPGGRASLAVPADDEGALLRVERLPDPGRGHVYQVWVQRGENVIPVSVLSVDASGTGAAAVPGSLDDVRAVMVTRERDAGVPAPTGTPVLSVEI